MCHCAIYRIFKEVPTYKLVSVSVLIDRMKVNGSIARKAIRTLEKEGCVYVITNIDSEARLLILLRIRHYSLIKPVVHSRSQIIYTRTTAAE